MSKTDIIFPGFHHLIKLINYISKTDTAIAFLKSIHQIILCPDKKTFGTALKKILLICFL